MAPKQKPLEQYGAAHQVACVRRCRAENARKKAFTLRLAGMTYEQISIKLKVTKKMAWDYVVGTLKEMKEETFEDALKVRELEVTRLDGILAKLWPRRQDPRTADTIIRLMDRRAKVLGLDMASQSKVEISGLEGMNDEQIAARVEAIIHAARTRGDGDSPPGDAEKA